MSSSNRAFNSFCAAGTNGRVYFSLSWGTSGDPASRPCKTWPRVPRLAKESVVPNRRSSGGSMPDKALVGGPLEWEAGIR